MIRRALIIYCDNTSSGALKGPSKDNEIYRDYLQSSLGGDWYELEVESLHNPTAFEVERMKLRFLNGADYTFIIFSGHGYTNADNGKQYIELKDTDISIISLKTSAKRQTLIIDACRGFFPRVLDAVVESRLMNFAVGAIPKSTRSLFEYGVLKAEMGWTILNAASVNQSAADPDCGGAYLYSLYKIAKVWEKNDKNYNILYLNIAHEGAVKYMNKNIETIQEPIMNSEKRRNYFPFAVKHIE